MNFYERWQQANFWYRFLRAYLPAILVLIAVGLIAVGPGNSAGLLLVFVLLVPSVALVIAFYEAVNWLAGRVKRK